MSEDHLLDDNILVPQTQPSPHSFSTQLVKRLRIKSFTNRRGDAIIPNTNNTEKRGSNWDNSASINWSSHDSTSTSTADVWLVYMLTM